MKTNRIFEYSEIECSPNPVTFFAETQNKLLYAVTQKTAAELVTSRANENQANMALTAWKGSIVRKQDIFIAKNYLNEDEIDTLNRLVVIFLETAELRAKERIDFTIHFWKENVDKILELNQKNILDHSGEITNAEMEKIVRSVYEKFDTNRKKYEAEQADQDDLELLTELEDKIKKS